MQMDRKISQFKKKKTKNKNKLSYHRLQMSINLLFFAKYGIIYIIILAIGGIIMKKRLIFEILAILLILLIAVGIIWVKQYFSNNLFEEGSFVVKSRKEQLEELRNNINENIEEEEKRKEFVETLITNNHFTEEEGEYLLRFKR